MNNDTKTDFFLSETSYSEGQSLSLKRTVINSCITLYILSVTAVGMPNFVDIPKEKFERTSVVSTYSGNWSRYNQGSIVFYYEGASMNPQLQNSFRVLDEIASLKDNWNDNNAPHFSESIIMRMRSIVSELSIQPNIFPTARRSIQFEYEKENGDYLEFELFEGGELKKFSYSNEGDSSTEYIDYDNVERIVQSFYE